MTHRLGPKHGMLASQTCTSIPVPKHIMAITSSYEGESLPGHSPHTGHSQAAGHMRTNWRLSPAGLAPYGLAALKACPLLPRR